MYKISAQRRLKIKINHRHKILSTHTNVYLISSLQNATSKFFKLGLFVINFWNLLKFEVIDNSGYTMATRMSGKIKIITTLVIYLCYFGNVSSFLNYFIKTISLFINKDNWLQALNFYIVGPTLIDLKELMATTIEHVSVLYTIRAISYTIGSLCEWQITKWNVQSKLPFQIRGPLLV